MGEVLDSNKELNDFKKEYDKQRIKADDINHDTNDILNNPKQLLKDTFAIADTDDFYKKYQKQIDAISKDGKEFFKNEYQKYQNRMKFIEPKIATLDKKTSLIFNINLANSITDHLKETAKVCLNTFLNELKDLVAVDKKRKAVIDEINKAIPQYYAHRMANNPSLSEEDLAKDPAKIKTEEIFADAIVEIEDAEAETIKILNIEEFLKDLEEKVIEANLSEVSEVAIAQDGNSLTITVLGKEMPSELILPDFQLAVNRFYKESKDLNLASSLELQFYIWLAEMGKNNGFKLSEKQYAKLRQQINFNKLAETIQSKVELNANEIKITANAAYTGNFTADYKRAFDKGVKTMNDLEKQYNVKFTDSMRLTYITVKIVDSKGQEVTKENTDNVKPYKNKEDGYLVEQINVQYELTPKPDIDQLIDLKVVTGRMAIAETGGGKRKKPSEPAGPDKMIAGK